MDWCAGAGAGVVPGLHGRVLGANADLALRRATRTDAAHDQAQRRRSRRPLRIVLMGTDARRKPSGSPKPDSSRTKRWCAMISRRWSDTPQILRKDSISR